MPGCHGRRGRRSKSLPPPSADRSDSADDTETAEHYHAAARTLKNVKASKGLAPATGRVALADTPRVQHAEYNTSWTSASLQAHSRYSGEGSDIASNETCGAWDYGNAAQPAPGSGTEGLVCDCSRYHPEDVSDYSCVVCCRVKQVVSVLTEVSCDA